MNGELYRTMLTIRRFEERVVLSAIRDDDPVFYLAPAAVDGEAKVGDVIARLEPAADL